MDAKCASCGTSGVPLKKCAKCHTAVYCNRECQTSDWKVHKKVCAKQHAQGQSARAPPPTAGTSENMKTSDLSPPKGLDKAIAKPYTAIDNRTYLHDRSEKDVYRLLIDIFRMRMEDDYNLDGDAESDSVYDGSEHSLVSFRRFLDTIAKRPGLLPPWWTAEKRKACEAFGMDKSNWQNLYSTVEKSDIIEHYGDPRFPMQLRLFGEFVVGRGPGGQDGSQIRKMMMSMEGGTQSVSTFGI